MNVSMSAFMFEPLRLPVPAAALVAESVGSLVDPSPPTAAARSSKPLAPVSPAPAFDDDSLASFSSSLSSRSICSISLAMSLASVESAAPLLPLVVVVVVVDAAPFASAAVDDAPASVADVAAAASSLVVVVAAAAAVSLYKMPGTSAFKSGRFS